MRMMPALETCEGEFLGSSWLVVVSQSTRRVTLLPFTLNPILCHLYEAGERVRLVIVYKSEIEQWSEQMPHFINKVHASTYIVIDLRVYVFIDISFPPMNR